MKRKLIILSLLVGLFLALPMVAQAQVVIERSTEIVSISGKQYYMHHVKRGETLYSLSKTYHVTEAEIIRLNPEINELGLQADMVIGIPVVIVDEPQRRSHHCQRSRFLKTMKLAMAISSIQQKRYGKPSVSSENGALTRMSSGCSILRWAHAFL